MLWGFARLLKCRHARTRALMVCKQRAPGSTRVAPASKLLFALGSGLLAALVFLGIATSVATASTDASCSTDLLGLLSKHVNISDEATKFVGR